MKIEDARDFNGGMSLFIAKTKKASSQASVFAADIIIPIDGKVGNSNSLLVNDLVLM